MDNFLKLIESTNGPSSVTEAGGDIRPTRSAPTLGEIFNLQELIASHPQADLSAGLKHTFSDGAYARELLLPAGSLVVGKVHRHGHLNIVSRGRATVWTTDGKREIDATKHPVTFVSTPGTKRVVLAHEPTVWTTIHLTKETDLAQIEAEIIVPEIECQAQFEQLGETA